jgi:hypothetical protein
LSEVEVSKFEKEIEDAIVKVKGVGFWCATTEKRLRNIVAMLVRHGLSASAIVCVITDFWTLVSAEYAE